MFMHLLNDEFDNQLSLAIQIFEGTYPRRFLNQLVSGQLDMDRLDYLKRDSFFTGVAEGVIGHDRIIAMLNVVDDEIVVEEKGLFSIEKFLVARRIMYLQVYLHKAVISAEQMIRKVMTTLREELAKADSAVLSASVLALLSHDAPGSWESKSVMLDTFASIDDVEIDYVLKSLMSSQHKVLNLLANGLINRRLFRTVFSNHRYQEEQISDVIKQVISTAGLSRESAEQLVLTGTESVPTYDPAQGDIRLLRKDGSVVNLPTLLEEHFQPHVYNRYFICYPAKPITS